MASVMIKGIFGKSSKNPSDVVKAIKEDVAVLERGCDAKREDKAREDLNKQLGHMKTLLLGSENVSQLMASGMDGSKSNSSQPPMVIVSTDQQSDIAIAQLSQEVYNTNLITALLANLTRIDFEGKKDVVQIFSNLLRRQIGTRTPTVEYICTRPEILTALCHGYEQQAVALNCGTMLRECIRFESLAKAFLYSDDFYKLFDFLQVSTFDIASDAFITFKEVLTRHKALASDFLDANYDTFFARYQQLLHSNNYVTRRQSLKLLGELLLDRHNFSVMTRYIANADNLKLMMNMLREKSRNIQFEAFHVFKVFVANPNKPKAIVDILVRNREKLVEFLHKFQSDRSEDDQFNDEKAYLIKQISQLQPMVASPLSTPSDQTGPSAAESSSAATEA